MARSAADAASISPRDHASCRSFKPRSSASLAAPSGVAGLSLGSGRFAVTATSLTSSMVLRMVFRFVQDIGFDLAGYIICNGVILARELLEYGINLGQ